MLKGHASRVSFQVCNIKENPKAFGGLHGWFVACSSSSLLVPIGACASLSRFLTRKKLELAGDGRCDSPGYSAKYGKYTLMEVQTDLIVDFQVIAQTTCHGIAATATQSYGYFYYCCYC